MERVNATGRAAPLVLELASGTAILHGEPVELPLREFRLLAALAARAGEPVAAATLIEAVWPDDAPWTSKEDLYVLVSKLRRLLDGETKLGNVIRNRRGFGYMLELDPSEVVIVEAASGAAERVITLEAEAPAAVSSTHEQQAPASAQSDAADVPAAPVAEVVPVPAEPTRPRTSLLRLVGIAALAFALLTGSWAAGYLLSQRDAARSDANRTSDAPPVESVTDGGDPDDRNVTDHKPEDPDEDKLRLSRRAGKNRADRRSLPAIAAPGSAGGTSRGNLTNFTAADNRSQGSRKGGENTAELPPAPTRYLYHLVNHDSGDHFVTSDGNTASDYEAKGYQGDAIGRVYTYQEKDTKAISTNYGTAYIFINSSPETKPESRILALWYATNDEGDFFYTTREAEAKQPGWEAALIGYVRAL